VSNHRLSPLPDDLAERLEERSAQVIERTARERGISIDEATRRFVEYLRAEAPELYVAYGLRTDEGQEIAADFIEAHRQRLTPDR
jgi:hypothetical protein